MFAEKIAEHLGFAVEDVSGLTIERLAKLRRVVFSVSTYGRGLPPPSAMGFWDALKETHELQTDQPVQFAVLGCGSSSFSATFAGFAKNIREKMTEIGCREVAAMCTRDEMEDEDDEKVEQWISQLKFM